MNRKINICIYIYIYIYIYKTSYLHPGSHPETAMDSIDANESLGGVVLDAIEKPYVVCQHDNKSRRNQYVIKY
jgi:hypothetical protein